MPSNWKRAKDAPFGRFDDYIQCDNEVLLIKKGEGIYSYDRDKEEWIFSDIYSNLYHWNEMYSKAVINKNNVYIIAVSMIYKYDKNGKLESKVPNIMVNAHSGVPHIIYHKKEIHGFMTSHGNFQHKVLSNDMKKTEDIHTNDLFHSYYNFYGVQTVGNQILIFGGWRRTNDGNIGPSDSMYTYNVRNGWRLNKTKLPKQMASFGFIATSNKNKQIVIFGGRTGAQRTDQIWIYDVTLDVFVLSRTRCPAPSKYAAINWFNEEKEELATFGYIRYEFNHNLNFQYIQIPPTYLIKLIDSFWRTEYVHLFSNELGEHFCSNIDRIYGNKRFISLPTEKSTERLKKESFVRCWISRQDEERKMNRNKSIDNKLKAPELIEQIGLFWGCKVCDRLFYEEDAAIKHVNAYHIASNTTSGVIIISGRYIIWQQHNVAAMYYCVQCADRRISVLFTNKSKVMNHGKLFHPDCYSKLM